jgi:hypothetical protein
VDGLLAHLEELGWAWIPPPSRTDPLDILSKLGPLISSHRKGADYHDLKPYRHDDAPPASMSATTGTGPQPMHTDAAYRPEPPRHVALQCMNPGEALCPTHVWSLDIDRLASDRPDVLTRPMWIARGGPYNPFYCTILEVIRCRVRIRFDGCCMTPTNGESETVEKAKATLASYARRYDFEWEQGALLIIDNWRCLHARGIGAHLAPSRVLRRWNIGAYNGLGS